MVIYLHFATLLYIHRLQYCNVQEEYVHQLEVFTSDLIVLDGFRFAVECKSVKKDVDLLDQPALLDKFL
ncbi:MAG: hypothetical protein FWG73_03990 [Planctomycetaceae bacterium]|nr:hypothetical protein [Planctomycetaceae bacterium]